MARFGLVSLGRRWTKLTKNNFSIDCTFNFGDLQMYDIIHDGQIIGDISIIIDYCDESIINIEHVEIDEEYWGMGFYQNVVRLLSRMHLCDEISGEVTSKRAYFALKKVYDSVETITRGGKIISEQECLDILPDEATIEEGRVDATMSVFVRCKCDRKYWT